MLESSQKYTRRATRLAKNKSYPFFRDYDPGTPVNGYYASASASLSTVSDYLLLRVFVLYYVPGSLWLRSLFSFGFWFIFATRGGNEAKASWLHPVVPDLAQERHIRRSLPGQ